MIRSLSLLAILSAVGCSHVGVTPMKEAVAKPENCKIEVYTDAKEIKRDYDVVCMLDSRTGSTLLHDRSVAGAIAQAKPEACKCGGDGMIVGQSTVEGMGLASWGEGTAMIKVIKFK